MAADSNFVHVNAIQIVAGVFQQIAHIGKVHRWVDEASWRRTAMPKSVSRDYDKATAR